MALDVHFGCGGEGGDPALDVSNWRDGEDDLEVVGEVLGVDQRHLQFALDAGATVVSLASRYDVSPQFVVDALVVDQYMDLAERLEYHELSDEQAALIRPTIEPHAHAVVYGGNER
jgi:hypothetical protein